MAENPMVKAEKVSFQYDLDQETVESREYPFALKDVDLQVEKGSFIAILGHNGSGKSTLARHINALLVPTGGSIWIDGIDTHLEEKVFEIRQRAGMIFQNPDNQMVASIVEEDVAFGPENLGVEPKEIRLRVDEALQAVGMESFVKSQPNRMSGGQKQRIAIAGMLAMKPECLVLDEPTAMLDPKGRREVMQTLLRLNREEKMTIIHITHYMEEAVLADQVFVMDRGQVVLFGTPREVFSQVETMKSLGLDVPVATEVAYELRKNGIMIPDDILTTEEMVNALCPSN